MTMAKWVGDLPHLIPINSHYCDCTLLRNDMENCINCGTDLIASIDTGAVCAKCEAQDNHDYDIEPDTEYDRSGRLIEKLITKWLEVGKLNDGSTKYANDRTGLSFFFHPVHGTYNFLGHPCAAREDGTLTVVDENPIDLAGKLLQEGLPESPHGSQKRLTDESDDA